MPHGAKAKQDAKQTVLSRLDMSTGPHGNSAHPTTQANEVIQPFTHTYPSGALNNYHPSASTPMNKSSQHPRPPPPAQPASARRQPTNPPPYNQVRDKLDISPENKQTRKDLLREAFFNDWKDDASHADLGNPDEMQKKDPLGTQIWKLYSKTKIQLPNQERMENLTWRMMAMNLKRKEREQARWVGLQSVVL